METKKTRKLLESLEMTQDALAEKVHVSPQKISMWLKRESIPKKYLFKVAKALQTTTDYLLDDSQKAI